VQTRIGDVGNCFAACLASILEEPLPEFGLTRDHDYDANVDAWLAERGLRYKQVPAGDVMPTGWHTIEGISPRGGMHATVGLNGKMMWDPHPQDGTGRGLKTVERYGLLMPTSARGAVKSLVVVWNDWPVGKPYELHAEGCKDIVNRPWTVYDRVQSAQVARQNRKYDPMITKPCVRTSAAKDALHIDVHGGVHRTHDAKLRGQFKKWAKGKDGLLPLPPTQAGRAAYEAGLLQRIEALKTGMVRGQHPHDLEQAQSQLNRLRSKTTDRARLHRALDAVLDKQ
jgi:hypothetical protein